MWPRHGRPRLDVHLNVSDNAAVSPAIVDYPGRQARATERRYVVPRSKARAVLAWIRRELAPDPNGAGEHADAYRVHTLYFDTPQRDVLLRRGSYGRAKYRIRRYGEGDIAFLERKLRSGNMLVKWRSDVPVDELSQWSAGGPGAQNQAARSRWFFRRVSARGLMPVCQMTYTRVARVASNADGICRLTVDDGLEYQHADGLEFGAAAGAPLLLESVIIELKYAVAPPPAFKAFVEHFALVDVPFSKYRLAMTTPCHG
jgi:hypothetical protein